MPTATLFSNLLQSRPPCCYFFPLYVVLKCIGDIKRCSWGREREHKHWQCSSVFLYATFCLTWVIHVMLCLNAYNCHSVKSLRKTLNYKPWSSIHCICLCWAFKWPVRLFPLAICTSVPPLNSLDFVLWGYLSIFYDRIKAYFEISVCVNSLAVCGPANSRNNKRLAVRLCIVVPQRSVSSKCILKQKSPVVCTVLDFWVVSFLDVCLSNIWV